MKVNYLYSEITPNYYQIYPNFIIKQGQHVLHINNKHNSIKGA